MCYTHDDSIPILSQHWVKRARKEHPCSECGRRIQPGEGYEYAFGVDSGDTYVWKICERCHYHAACIYALERSRGCAEWESRPPLGGGMLHEDLEHNDLRLDDDLPDEAWADAEADGEPGPHFVVRWHHIDDARAGKTQDAPFTQEVARRLGLYPVQ
jgi:hypothetical protein